MLQDIYSDLSSGEFDALILLGPPGCGKTQICRRLVAGMNASLHRSACLCAHSAQVAVNIGGETMAHAFKYGFWQNGPQFQYLSGQYVEPAQYKLIVLEETQAAGTHMLSDMATRLRKAHEQV